MASASAATVLVVDDEEPILRLFCDELSAAGFNCLGTESLLVAQQWVDTQSPDLVVSDICMPDGNGLDLLAHVRKSLPDCKVILVTGNSQREYISQALLLGAFDYLEKPVDLEELAGVARRALRKDASPLHTRAAAAMEAGTQAKRAALDSVRALARAVEAKDPYTRRHSDQVAHYAVNLAQAMGLPQATIQSIQTAALLHDVGKIGVPDHILTKSGPLSGQEFEYIRRHPALGADILANITVFGEEAQLVRHHHERWDGKGYPDSLAGEASPLGARIIQVGDCIDAMLMERTYKSGYSPQKMIGELSRCAGTQFDPNIAAVAAQWCTTHPGELILPKASVEAVHSP